MEESDIAQLALHHIIPCPATASFICSKPESCGVEIATNRKQFLQHLRRGGHKISKEIFEPLWQCAMRCAISFPGTYPIRAQYREGGWSHGYLPAIQGLPIVHAFKCTLCDCLFEKEETLRRHGKEAHGTSIARSTIRDLVRMPCQTLSPKKGTKKLFLVATETRCGDHEALSTGVMTAVANYDPGAVLSRHVRAASDREKSGFVSLAFCQERLDVHNLQMQDAWRLTTFLFSGDNEAILSLSECLSQCLEELLVEARDMFRGVDSFRSTLVDIAASGTLEKRNPFRFLDNDEIGQRSVERYARSARVLILIACRVHRDKQAFPGICMSEEQMTATEDLLHVDKENAEKVKEKVHRLLCSIFFQRSSIGGGATRLFASAVAACLCVGGDCMDKVHFRQGLQVSPNISGILYTSSCCALLEIRKYSEEEIREEVEQEVRAVMSVDAKAGVSLFVDLRSICATVRAEETKMNMYHICRLHKNCGILRGIELCASAVGDAVLNMHRDLRHSIFTVLLKGKGLPENFESSCEKMVDDCDSLVPGYWALADLRNAAFVRTCMTWLQQNIVVELSASEVAAWCKAATDLVPLLLTVVHLSGGAPSRGTELGSLSIRNTHSRKRGFFFVAEEVMVIPTFSKRRGILRGHIDFTSRHLEKESSFLFKAFFLLLHPIIVGQSQMEDVPAGREGEAVLRKQSLVTDNVCLGSIAPEDVARRIGEVFAKYKIPFTFSQYRHWQRGYAKMRGSKSYMRRVYRLEHGEEDWEDEDGVFKASISQAGHSLRTAITNYAQSARPGDVSIEAEEDLVELFRRASIQWQEDIGLRKKAVVVVADGSPVTIFETPACRRSAVSENQMDILADSVANRVLEKLGGIAPSIAQAIRPSGREENIVRELIFDELATERESQASTEMVASVSVSPDIQAPEFPRNSSKSAYANGFEPHEALRKATKHSAAQFRSEEQRKAMVVVARRRSDVAVVLATGCGKTAVVMGPCLYEPGVTIWVSPLRALLYETKNRLLRAGIFVQRLGQYTEYRSGVGRVLLLAPEQIGRPELHGVTNRLSREGNLNRIVIDEAHIPLFSHTYRTSMVRLQSMADLSIDCQRVLLTATAPRAMLERIAPICGVAVDGLEVIRGDPCRPNLCLNVVRLADSSMGTLKRRVVVEVQLTIARCRSGSGEGARGLVVCLTIADVELFLKAVQEASIRGVSVLKYHSKLSDAERQRASMQWEKAKKDVVTVMIATDGFCTGTDAPNVRSVIAAGGARSLVEFWQGCGRGGRDGKKANVTVLYHCGHLFRARGGDVPAVIEGVGSFNEWAENDKECRRLRMERFLEGLASNPTCIERGVGSVAVELCNICKDKRGTVSEGQIEDRGLSFAGASDCRRRRWRERRRRGRSRKSS